MSQSLNSLADTICLPHLNTEARGLTEEVNRLWLEIGDTVRYQGIGAGQVIRHETRDFRGRSTTFAVIDFPHRDMTAQVPLGDDSFADKLCPVDSAASVERALSLICEEGRSLARCWDEREKYGGARLRSGSPTKWAEVLRDYACACKRGVSITASDADLVREAIQLLAAEYCCAVGAPFEQAEALVQDAYREASLNDR